MGYDLQVSLDLIEESGSEVLKKRWSSWWWGSIFIPKKICRSSSLPCRMPVGFSDTDLESFTQEVEHNQ